MSTNYIAKWNGSSWSALESGMSDTVSALMVFDDGGGEALYAAGWFTTAGGVSANRIAKWNGSAWSALGSGISDGVKALTVFDDGGGSALYAGGYFVTAGGVSANRIAKWNPGAPGSWSPLGTGMEGGSLPLVVALAVFDDGGGPALYAGGNFTTAGGVSANNIAKWNGASWSSLGSGVEGGCQYCFKVAAIRVFDDGGRPSLYAGGHFTTAGGVPANRIAKWDGTRWSPVGSGMNGSVSALTVFDDGGGEALYAGGSFTAAGGVVSARLAKWACGRLGDMNEDAMVDLSDFAMFFDCMTGPGQTVSEPACELGDVDYDHRIDLWDFATLQQAFGQ